MHSIIIYLSKCPDTQMSIDEVQESLVPHIADYVSYDISRWSPDHVFEGDEPMMLHNEDGTVSVNPVYRENRMRRKYEDFLEEAEKCTHVTFEEFNDTHRPYSLYLMNEAYDNDRGIIVFLEDDRTHYSWDTFLRYTQRGILDDKYYYGGILDYHF